MNKEWVGRLLSAMDGLVDRKTGTALSMLDLGTIQADGSLVLDQFPPPIPPEAYLVAEWDLAIPDTSRVVRMAAPVTEDGEDTGDTHYSEPTRIDFTDDDSGDLITDVRPRFAVGDRVLALWLSNDPIVLCKVVSGDDA